MPYRVEIRVRNGALWKAIHRNFPNVRQFCIANGLDEVRIGKLLNMGASPLNKRMEWTQTALKVADVIGVLPDELWPDYMRERMEVVRGAVELDRYEVQQLMASSDPVACIAAAEDAEGLRKYLEKLNPRTAEIICRRYGINGREEDLKSIADSLGISGTRARQVMESGFRKIRKLALPAAPVVEDCAEVD